MSKDSYLILKKAYSTWGNCSKRRAPRFPLRHRQRNSHSAEDQALLYPLKLTNCWDRSLVFISAKAGERRRWQWTRQKRSSSRELVHCPRLLRAAGSRAGILSSQGAPSNALSLQATSAKSLSLRAAPDCGSAGSTALVLRPPAT